MKTTRGHRRRVLGAYIRERLKTECAVRGVAAKIAHATGFSSAHITNVQKEDRGVGEDLAEALAVYWGFGALEGLYAEAERWAKENPDKVGGATPAPSRAPGGEPHPARSLAAQLARDAGIAEEAIAAVLAEVRPSTVTSLGEIVFELAGLKVCAATARRPEDGGKFPALFITAKPTILDAYEAASLARDLEAWASGVRSEARVKGTAAAAGEACNEARAKAATAAGGAG